METDRFDIREDGLQSATKQLRKVWRDYWNQAKLALARGTSPPPFPDSLRGLTCGAKSRRGSPCKLTAIYSNGRCKFHGGCSTGPRSAEGRAKSAQNGKLGGWHKYFRKPEPNPMGQTRLGQGLEVTDPARCSGDDAKPHEDLIKVKVTVRSGGGEMVDLPKTVRCRDCNNLSAGFTCLAAANGEITGVVIPYRPALGEFRHCASFAPASID
jgi:hypothetical protein